MISKKGEKGSPFAQIPLFNERCFFYNYSDVVVFLHPDGGVQIGSQLGVPQIGSHKGFLQISSQDWRPDEEAPDWLPHGVPQICNQMGVS